MLAVLAITMLAFIGAAVMTQSGDENV